MTARRWIALSMCLGINQLAHAEPVSDAPPTKALSALPPVPAVTTPANKPLVTSPVATPATSFGSVPCDAEPVCTPACDTLCGPPGKCWASGEWLYWVGSGNPLPVLATGSPAGTPRTGAGVIGSPGTAALFGGQRANNDFRNGFRLNAGTWLNDDQTFGLAGNFFFLGQSNQGFAAGSNGTQIVSRPFVNGLTGAQDSELVSFPGVLAGSVVANSTSDVIGGGFNFLCNHCCSPSGRFDWLAGFRYLNLRDNLSITENLTALPGSSEPAGTRIVVNDQFRTNNNFYGGNIGGQFERRFGRLFVGGTASVALGVSHQELTIRGSTAVTPPGGATTVRPGGLLAQTSNIGRYTNDEFAVIPEVGLRAGAQVTDNLRLFVGYNFIYWSSVLRAGDQIDPRVNPNLIPPQTLPVVGPQLPAPRLVTTDYWLQGVSVGGEFRF